MLKTLYKHRFEIFLATQVFILFGSLFFPADFHEYVLLPILFLLNIISGILLISKKKKIMWFLITLFIISLGVFGSSMLSRKGEVDEFILVRLSVYFIFYIVVTWNIIKQVWAEKKVDKTVIMGLMSGYISLGFLAFFMFMSIELVTPGSFAEALLEEANAFDLRSDSIMYYSYITLLTIGYGEIVPVTPIAQKASILVGLVGQFYIAIITAVVVEKYIRFTTQNND